VVVGGTGLYVRVLLKGLRPAPPADPAFRRELESLAEALGAPALHERLRAVDPARAGELHPNDRLRIIRALEISRAGQPAEPGASWQTAVPPFRVLMIGLRQSREALDRRLGDRVQAMIASGMMDEVKRLRRAGYAATVPAMAGIGYRQFSAVLDGSLAEPEAARLMLRDTIRYARRQMTWFARDPEIRWLDVEAAGGLDGAADAALKLITEEGLAE
jgi:tRNA dimethylallyltransferase